MLSSILLLLKTTSLENISSILDKIPVLKNIDENSRKKFFGKIKALLIDFDPKELTNIKKDIENFIKDFSLTKILKKYDINRKITNEDHIESIKNTVFKINNIINFANNNVDGLESFMNTLKSKLKSKEDYEESSIEIPFLGTFNIKENKKLIKNTEEILILLIANLLKDWNDLVKPIEEIATACGVNVTLSQVSDRVINTLEKFSITE